MIAGAVGAMWALIVGVGLVLGLVLLTWTVSPNAGGEAAAAVRASGMTWVGIHLVPIQIGESTLSVFPLGALVLGLVLNRRGGRWAARFVASPSHREIAGILLGGMAMYGLGGAGVAWLCSEAGLRASPGSALLHCAVVAGLGIGWGVAVQEGMTRWRTGQAEKVRRTLTAGFAAALAIGAVGATLVALSLARSYGQVAASLGQADAGIAGTAMLTTVNALSLPNLAIWAGGFVLGPGLQLGDTGYLTLWSGSVMHLPALPVLAAIPAAPPGWAPALLALPVLAGIMASRMRWGRDLPTLVGAIVAAAWTSAVAALVVAGAATLASGSLSGGELAFVGVRALPAAACAAALIALGMVLDALMQVGSVHWQLYRAQSRVARDRPSGPSEPAP